MESKEPDDICKSLIEKRKWPYEKREIEEIWLPIKEKLSSQKQVQLLVCLSQQSYIFPWLRLISYAIPDLSTNEDGFLELLKNIVGKVKNDLAQGDFITSLITLGEKQPERAIELYQRLIKTGDSSLIEYSGLILGGAARKDFPKTFSIIREDFAKGVYPIKVACIKALRVGLENVNFAEKSDEIFSILNNAIGQPDDAVKIEAIQAYIDFDKIRPDLSEPILKDTAQKGSSLIRLVIVDRLWLVDLVSRQNEIEILKLCSADNDPKVMESIARVLAKKGQDFIPESLEIIKELLWKPYFSHGPMFDYYLEEFAKGKMESILEAIKLWVKEGKDDRTMRLKISEALVDFASKETMDEVRSILKTWIEGDDLDLKWIAMKTTIALFEKGHFAKENCEKEFSILKAIKEEPIRKELESELWCLFAGRPLFTSPDIVIRIISDWAHDPDWHIRLTIIHSLSNLAEYKIDSEETLHLLLNKETKESRVRGITTKKVFHDEGIAAYNLLKELTEDKEERVQTLAKNEISRVDVKLKQKEIDIDDRIEKQPKISSEATSEKPEEAHK